MFNYNQEGRIEIIMGQEKTKGYGWFGIAMAYPGIVVGAGFASGQELFQFFGAFGGKGILSAVIAGTLFSVLGAMCMLIARNLGTGDYEKVVSPNSKIVNVFFNLLITFFSFGVMVIMFAGASSLFASVTGLNSTIGAIFTVVLVAVIVLMGGEATVKSFAWTIPVMVVIGAIMAIIAFTTGDGSVADAPIHLDRASTPHWLIAPFVYVSYNMICSVCGLSPIGFEARSRRDAVIGGIVGGATIGGLALLILLGMLKNQAAMLENDMPMYAMAAGMNKYLGWAYALMLMIAILTTAIALLFGLVERLAAYDNIPVFKNKKLVVVAISVLGLFGSFVGFTKLVGTLYPLTGYIGLLLIIALFWNYFRTRNRCAEFRSN